MTNVLFSRVTPQLKGAIEKIAKTNRRPVVEEVRIALERHVDEHKKVVAK